MKKYRMRSYDGKTVSVLVPYKSKETLPKYSDIEMTEIAGSVGLTLEQLKEAHKAVYHVYQYIGADLASVNEGKYMKRDDVIEVCNDAGRPVDLSPKLTPEVKEWFSTKSFHYPLEVIYAALAPAFPFAEYE